MFRRIREVGMSFAVIGQWTADFERFADEEIANAFLLEKEEVRNLVIIIDRPGHFVEGKHNIFIQVEPEVIFAQQHAIVREQHRYKRIYSFNKYVLMNCSNAYSYVYGTCFLPKEVYENVDITRKKFAASNLAGSKLYNNASGHRFRQTIHFAQERISSCVSIPITFFRSHQQPVIAQAEGRENPMLNSQDKRDLFLDFQFAIVIENSRQENYFTEKLIDCLVTETIPIYYGCPNIADYFDVTGWILLTSDSIDMLISAMQTLKEDHYAKHHDIVKKNKQTALSYTNFASNVMRGKRFISAHAE